LILQLQECNELLQEAKSALEEGKNYTFAIEASGEVIDAGGQVVGAALCHDCLCVRAAAFLKVWLYALVLLLLIFLNISVEVDEFFSQENRFVSIIEVSSEVIAY
jgi:hypothetical protein